MRPEGRARSERFVQAVSEKPPNRPPLGGWVAGWLWSLPAVFAALVDVKFDGLLVLEYEGDFDDMAKRLDGMRRSLVVMERLIAAAPPRA